LNLQIGRLPADTASPRPTHNGYQQKMACIELADTSLNVSLVRRRRIASHDHIGVKPVLT
jgi:hypothetical protein